MLKFSTSPDTCLTKNMLMIFLEDTPVTQIILCIENHTVHNLFDVCCNHTMIRENQNPKHAICSLSFWHLWPWNKVKVIKPRMTMWTPKEVMRMQSLKDLALMVCEKKPTWFFFKRGNMSVISLEHERKSKIVVYSWSTRCNQQSYKVSTEWDNYCDHEIQSRSLTLMWMSKAQWEILSCNVWHLSSLYCSRNLQHLSCCHIWTLSWLA